MSTNTVGSSSSPPAERHAGLDTAILAERRLVLELTKAQHPRRWSRGVRNYESAGAVMLNPSHQQRLKKAA